jgi:thiol-disulfide isomerase/thioredoxin
MQKVISTLFFFALISCKVNKDEISVLPSFNILLPDSITLFNTGDIKSKDPFVIIYFSPDCEHCQEETESILKNIKLFKSNKLFFITNDPFDRLKVFDKHYRIFNYPNILLGWDYSYFMLYHYKPRGTPYFAVYDKNKELRMVYDGGIRVDTLISALKSIN